MEAISLVLKLVNGRKTYLAAIGFVGAALVAVSQDDYSLAYTSILQAVGLVGLRHAVQKQSGS